MTGFVFNKLGIDLINENKHSRYNFIVIKVNG